MNINKVKLQSEKIGTFEVILTNEQMEQVISNGAEVLKEVREKEIIEQRFSFRKPGSNYGSNDIEEGFTGNSIDWKKYFPDVSSQEIDKLIDGAFKYEEKLRAAMNAALILVGVGITTAMTGNLSSVLGLIKVVDILGPYFYKDQTTTDDSLD